MNILKGSDLNSPQSVRVLIYAPPGSGKTSLALTANRPLLLDFDKGSFRSKQRYLGDVAEISSWKDVQDFIANAPKYLANYDTVVVDTVGRLLDFAIIQLGEESAKNVTRNGNPTLQGYGELKGLFVGFMRALTAVGKDVVLIAHDKEQMENDNRFIRPDIVGGSYAEVMKQSDFVGYLFYQGRKKVIDFSPCDRYYGKNSAGFGLIEVPDFAQNEKFMGGLIQQMKDSFAAQLAGQQKASSVVAEHEDIINTFEVAEDFQNYLPTFLGLKDPVRTGVAAVLRRRREHLGISYDKETQTFSNPVTQPA